MVSVIILLFKLLIIYILLKYNTLTQSAFPDTRTYGYYCTSNGPNDPLHQHIKTIFMTEYKINKIEEE